MARQRRSSRKRNESVATGDDSGTQTQTNERQGVTRMAGLTPEAVAALLSKTRTKGQYIQYLNEFIASGEMGVEANEQWVALRDKQATTLKQGFDNAKDHKDAADGAENIQVIKSEDKVYLVNLAHEDIATQTEEAA